MKYDGFKFRFDVLGRHRGRPDGDIVHVDVMFVDNYAASC